MNKISEKFEIIFTKVYVSINLWKTFLQKNILFYSRVTILYTKNSIIWRHLVYIISYRKVSEKRESEFISENINILEVHIHSA